MAERLIAPNAAPFLLEGGEDAVLLLHGFTGSAGHMRPLGDALHAAGFTVQGILLPGHGTRIEDMDTEGGAGPWKEAAFSAYRELLAKYRSVSVMGLSMGGALALLIAEAEPAPACLVTLSAPMLLQNRFTALSPVFGLFVDVLPDGKHRRREDDFLHEYDINYKGTPVHRVPDLRRLIHEARKDLARVTCPTLVVQSHADPTVRPVSAEIIYNGISSTEKGMLWLEKSGHIVTLGPDREVVFERAVTVARLATGQPLPEEQA